jgi:hypothetical protein
MEVIAVLRLLWRRRLLVVLGAALAVGAALLVGGNPVPDSGFAATRVAIDTPKSQLVTDAPLGSDSLPWRATLLATLLGTESAREQVARDAGIRTDQLAMVELELTAPPVAASLPRAAVKASNATTEPYVLTVHTDDVLPLIEIETHAPDRAGAARLAEAAVAALQSGASPRDTTDLQGLSIERVGAIEAITIPGGAGRAKLAGVAMVVFVLWCSALTLIPAIRSALRTVRADRALA